MALQGWIDDSGQGDSARDPVFVLAGFIASAEQWALFSKEWRSTLDAPPSIAYFKMTEAAHLSGEFSKKRRGWTVDKRDTKLTELTTIIAKYAAIKVSCAVDKKAFAKYARPIAVPNRTSILDKPYATAFQHIILATAGTFLAFGINEACDFVFDEQGKIGTDAVAMWDGLKSIIKTNAARGRHDFTPYLGQRPTFRDDKLFLPLQAADLYAWHVRREFSENRLLYVPPRKVMRDLSAISTISRYVDERELADFRKHVDKGAAVFAGLRPNIPLIGYQGSKAQQKRERVAARAQKRNAADSAPDSAT